VSREPEDLGVQEFMKVTYLKQPPKKFTFEQPQLKRWIEQRSRGKVLNLFAGNTRLLLDEVRVDSNPRMPADYHMDAHQFVAMAREKNLKFDTVILDPPYTMRKSREKYQGHQIGKFTQLKDQLMPILAPDATVIQLGWSSTGMGKVRGFRMDAICLVNHSGDHDDTIVTVERRMNERLP
jgi:hypothetical protein